jgi:syntaxin 5
MVVAKRKTLFDDKSTEIAELIYVIKHDISELNNDIANLQTFVKQSKSNSRGRGKKERDEHNDNVVVLLQSKLANTSMGFKDVLEIRTQVTKLWRRHLSEVQNMKASQDRSEQFISGAGHSATPPPTLSASSPLYNPIPRPRSEQSYRPKSNILSLSRDEEGIGMPSQMQSMDLIQQQDQYISHRGQAIQSIESTIHELGSIFQQLAQMVSEQAESVQRYTLCFDVLRYVELMRIQMIL